MIHNIDPKPVIGYGPGDTVIFHGTSDVPARWGSGDDPRTFLTEGREYQVSGVEIHDSYTKIFLAGFEGKKFPSVAFHLRGQRQRMTVGQWAEKLNGIEYPASEIDEFNEELAEDGIIVAYGASDDLLEFCGVIKEEAQAWRGTEVRLAVNPGEGTPELFNEEENRKTLEFNRKEIDRMKTVKAIWEPADIAASWKIETEIPHEIFNIMEDGEVFCQGIVFAVKDIWVEEGF